MTYAEQMDRAILSLYQKWPVYKEPEVIPKTIGERIKKAREKAGYSLMALKEVAGSDANTIKKWERGTTTPSVFRTVELADALYVSPEYLLGCTLGEALSTMGARVKYAREEARVSHDTLAKALKKKRYIVGNLEANNQKPTEAQKKIICEVLEVSIEWLEGKE